MNKDELFQQLRQSELPTVIDFWAPWCVPCRRTKPILDKLGQEFADRVNFQAINADENPELIRELKVLSIPTLLIVDSNKEINRMIGAQPPDSYRQLFESLATGEGSVSISISNRDRFFRLGIGAVLAIMAWMYANWWLLPIGLAMMFWGIYDRCPIWQAISTRFKTKL
jgi:thioredoxin